VAQVVGRMPGAPTSAASGSKTRRGVVICSWLALQEYLATCAATYPGAQLRVLVAGEDAGVQLLAEVDVDRRAVAGITIEAGIGRSFPDRVAQLFGRDTDSGRGGAVLGAIEADDGVMSGSRAKRLRPAASRTSLGSWRQPALARGAVVVPACQRVCRSRWAW
jgi:hypothetical protein